MSPGLLLSPHVREDCSAGPRYEGGVAEALCFAPETTTALLIGCAPILNK